LQLERISAYFNEAAGGRYVSRAIEMNLESICSFSASTPTSTMLPEAVMYHVLL